MNKNSFILYTDIIDVLEALTDDQKGKLFFAIVSYERNGTVPEIDDQVVKIAFIPVKQQLDRLSEEYASKVSAKRSAGLAGAAKRWQKMTDDSKPIAEDGSAIPAIGTDDTGNSEIAKMAVNDNDPVNDTKREKVKREKFVPPTIEEVRAYCQERKNDVYPEAFVAHYQSVGWKIGKNPMKDWRAAVRTWESRQKSRIEETKAAGMAPKAKKNSFNDFEQNHYTAEDFAAMEEWT